MKNDFKYAAAKLASNYNANVRTGSTGILVAGPDGSATWFKSEEAITLRGINSKVLKITTEKTVEEIREWLEGHFGE